VNDDGSAVRVPVTFGRIAAATIEIVRGPRPGDRVILSDMSQWSPLFIEQMFSTLLYIWIKTWRKEVFKAALEKKPIPKLIEIEKPDFFNLYRYGT
jgi:hypothetical protein